MVDSEVEFFGDMSQQSQGYCSDGVSGGIPSPAHLWFGAE